MDSMWQQLQLSTPGR